MRQFKSIQPRVEAERISTADDGRIVVEVHQVVSSLDGDQLADERVVHRFTFLGDLIRCFDIG